MPAFPLIRHFSGPLSKLLIRLPITPNQITTTSLIFGVIGCLFFIHPEYQQRLIGSIIFLLAYILDNCDGEVARHKNLTSNFGKNYDTCVDWIVNSGFFAALGFGVAEATGNDIWFWLGLVGSAGSTINYFITVFHNSPTEPEKITEENTAPKTVKDQIIYVFRELFRADFCFIVLALTLVDFLWILLPAGAIGAQVYWILFLMSKRKQATDP